MTPPRSHNPSDFLTSRPVLQRLAARGMASSRWGQKIPRGLGREKNSTDGSALRMHPRRYRRTPLPAPPGSESPEHQIRGTSSQHIPKPASL